jgi:hypothetical protein
MATEPSVPLSADLATPLVVRTTPLRARAPFALLLGATAGAAWGVVARAWMRLISHQLEFSWGGTIAIITIFALFGFGQALAALTRRPGHSRRAQIGGRVVAIAATLPLGVAAGSIMLPATLLGAIALGRSDWHRLIRLALALLAAVPIVYVLSELLNDLPLWRALVGWLLMLVVYTPLVWALSRSLRPLPELRPAVT